MFPRAVPLKFENINKKNDFVRISANTKDEKVHYFFVYINVLLIFLGNESYLNFFSLAVDCFHHKNLKFASFLFQMAFTRNVKENDHGFSVFPKQIKINYVFSLPFCCLTFTKQSGRLRFRLIKYKKWTKNYPEGEQNFR